MKFIDYVAINVKAGKGGNGCIAFLREKFRPMGGPSGGDGGHGGDIILKVNSQLSTLNDLTYTKHYSADNGEHGKGKNMHGKNGKNVIIPVPKGTLIKDFNTKHVIADLIEENQEFVVAKGGKGGFGNARFKTQSRTAPRIANNGKLGEIKEIELELKILADVGLVGFPNAGKSTFISKVSNAKPKIADYPFTTLVPNLGIVKYSDFKSFVIADIPGLIKNASQGKGLGSIFLRHIERSKALVFMLDINDEDVLDSFNVLYNELDSHNSKLIKKPFLILITKADTVDEKKVDSIKSVGKHKTIPISSMTGLGIKSAIIEISKLFK